MSIEKNERGMYDLICDICTNYEEFETFNEAVEFKKEFGWKSEKKNNEWIDICEECKD